MISVKKFPIPCVLKFHQHRYNVRYQNVLSQTQIHIYSINHQGKQLLNRHNNFPWCVVLNILVSKSSRRVKNILGKQMLKNVSDNIFKIGQFLKTFCQIRLQYLWEIICLKIPCSLARGRHTSTVLFEFPC